MGKWKTKPKTIEALTFAELVKFGKQVVGVDIVKKIPQNFEYKGHGITYENDKCYLVPTITGIGKMTPDHMLVRTLNGNLMVEGARTFKKDHVKVK